MTPQSIRRAAKVLRRQAKWMRYLYMANMRWVEKTVIEDHHEMIDLARQLEQLAKQTATATE